MKKSFSDITSQSESKFVVSLAQISFVRAQWKKSATCRARLNTEQPEGSSVGRTQLPSGWRAIEYVSHVVWFIDPNSVSMARFSTKTRIQFSWVLEVRYTAMTYI